jgi:hypothetical protein
VVVVVVVIVVIVVVLYITSVRHNLKISNCIYICNS